MKKNKDLIASMFIKAKFEGYTDLNCSESFLALVKKIMGKKWWSQNTVTEELQWNHAENQPRLHTVTVTKSICGFRLGTHSAWPSTVFTISFDRSIEEGVEIKLRFFKKELSILSESKYNLEGVEE